MTTDIMLELKRQLMIQQGLNPDHTVEVPELDTESEKERARLNAEATLRHLNWPLSPRVNKRCKACGFYFVTEYASVAYCGALCAKETLARYGISWSDKPLKDHYGGMQPPGLITPDALRSMAEVLRLTGYTVIDPDIESYTADEAIKETEIDQESEEPLPQGDYLKIEPEQIQTKNETLKTPDPLPLLEDDDAFLSFL